MHTFRAKFALFMRDLQNQLTKSGTMERFSKFIVRLFPKLRKYPAAPAVVGSLVEPTCVAYIMPLSNGVWN